ncbi:hypothetical protein PybrP1_009482 [[Pythium] brassicae (nom. inval.)]|nr:hypothetical protein PybrP1_009482 [[Pythium] brassicae (nom. inval.)]
MHARVPLVIAAAVTTTLLTLQLGMVHVLTGAYAPADFSPEATVAAAAKARVFEPLPTRRALPVVLMHGMGDAAGNSGMQRIRDEVAKHLDTYAMNVQIGSSVSDDVRNSFFMTMDQQLEAFAEAVGKDSRLAGGFNAVGFSQGNLLIRGYIQRYNKPPVANFVSFHGPLAGLIGDAVYSDAIQSRLAQANYFRDPLRIKDFLAHAKFLPDLNNEKLPVNATYRANFMTLESLVLVRAEHDTQVFPKDSEWFGAYADGDAYKRVLGFNETKWYREDSFGLQSLDRAGKVHFLSTEGNHLQFSTASSSSDGGAKRKLEHVAATTMPTQRRRGSEGIARSDSRAIMRSLSDGIISDTSKALCPTSPTVVPLNALQKQQSVISPRAGVSPRLNSSARFATPCDAGCDELDVDIDDDDDDRRTDPASCSASPRKHGQLAPLRMECRQPESSPPRSPPCSSGAFARGRSTELLAPLRSVAASPPLTLTLSQSSPRLTFHGGGSHIAVHSPAGAMSAAERAEAAAAATATDRARAPKCTAGASSRSPWPQQPKKTRNPGNLSLDLSQMEPPALDAASSAGGMRHRDSAATCSRVTDFLFVGGAAAAKNRAALRAAGVTHVINCAANVAPDFFPDDFVYYNLRLRDHSSQDIARHFYTVFDFIETARRRGGRVFVHCVKGISRSPTMAIAYLMWYKRIGMYKALDLLRQARPVVDPNAGFIFQLTEWEHLHSGGGPLRVLERAVAFRVELPRESSSSSSNGSGSSHTARAAEKPQLVGPLAALGEDFFHQPSKDAAKLSFVVAGADAMFVWCGAEASELQVEAAQHAAALLQTYEAFPEKYEIVFHGQESAPFWSLVGALAC